jgi:hypothetical protein
MNRLDRYRNITKQPSKNSQSSQSRGPGLNSGPIRHKPEEARTWSLRSVYISSFQGSSGISEACTESDFPSQTLLCLYIIRQASAYGAPSCILLRTRDQSYTHMIKRRSPLPPSTFQHFHGLSPLP